ncbi:MAG: hypothetical protein ACUVR8_00005 [Acidobacteriota bacterium]
MSAPCRQRFWTGSLFIACLIFSPLLAPAQGSTDHPKPPTAKTTKKRGKGKPATGETTSPVTDPTQLPLGVQDNLAEAKRLQEQYRREETARRRAEAEARKKGLPWPPPEEANPEKPSEPPSPVPETVSQPAPLPEEETPPPTEPPVEQQPALEPGSESSNSTPSTAPTVPPAGGKTIIRTWPQGKKMPGQKPM